MDSQAQRLEPPPVQSSSSFQSPTSVNSDNNVYTPITVGEERPIRPLQNPSIFKIDHLPNPKYDRESPTPQLLQPPPQIQQQQQQKEQDKPLRPAMIKFSSMKNSPPTICPTPLRVTSLRKRPSQQTFDSHEEVHNNYKNKQKEERKEESEENDNDENSSEEESSAIGSSEEEDDDEESSEEEEENDDDDEEEEEEEEVVEKKQNRRREERPNQVNGRRNMSRNSDNNNNKNNKKNMNKNTNEKKNSEASGSNLVPQALYLSREEIQPCRNPTSALSEVMNSLKTDDWDKHVNALNQVYIRLFYIIIMFRFVLYHFIIPI